MTAHHFTTRLHHWLAGLSLALFASVACALAPLSDELEARFGPQALEQRHRHAAVEVMTLGEGARRVYVFLPSQPGLRAAAAPMVFFHHGWQGMNPLNFGALIDHLVRSGQVVIYPVYQQSEKTPPQIVTAQAAQANRRALSALQQRHGITPDAKRVLYYGYSMGAAISLTLALNPAAYQLPAPRALVLVAPGDAHHVAKGEQARSIIGPVEKLPADLPVALLTGAADTTIGLPTARLLASRLCHIKADRRVLMVLPSDAHAGRKVNAAHGSPGAPDSRYNFEPNRRDIPTHIAGRAGFEASASLNQLDFYGYWKVLDAMIDSLGKGYLPDSVFGSGTPQQVYLGRWADGVRYPEAVIEQRCF
jgi:acetyl esterase/lipase